VLQSIVNILEVSEPENTCKVIEHSIHESRENDKGSVHLWKQASAPSNIITFLCITVAFPTWTGVVCGGHFNTLAKNICDQNPFTSNLIATDSSSESEVEATEIEGIRTIHLSGSLYI